MILIHKRKIKDQTIVWDNTKFWIKEKVLTAKFAALKLKQNKTETISVS